ncbi:MAG: hypothetical protein KGK30_09170, partial [Elusimicrobia bacterium]|nr:hypothetical protein [Elusimicrobiota bacterium]
KHLARAILSGYGAPRLKPADGARWGKQARRMLRREFPTLRRILADPLKTERLLAALGFLRLVHASYKYCHVTGLPMGVWGREHRVEFPLNELLFRPVSGSFRRHLLASERSPRQLQLKIPGEDKNRDWISPAHFEAAAELMAAYPDLELAPEPIHLGQWTGRARLYGKDLRFDENNPLGVMIFDYKDGQRLKYAAWLADAIDPSRRMELLLKAMADAAAGSIVAHRLGWQGNGEAGADMHTENASVFVDGAELRGMLSGDFGAWWKNSGLTMRQRSKETLNLIGWPDEWRLEVIAAQVLDILGRGRGAAQRQQLQREIRLELGMDE